MTIKDNNRGRSFESFLEENGIAEEVKAEANKKLEVLLKDQKPEDFILNEEDKAWLNAKPVGKEVI